MRSTMIQLTDGLAVLLVSRIVGLNVDSTIMWWLNENVLSLILLLS